MKIQFKTDVYCDDGKDRINSDGSHEGNGWKTETLSADPSQVAGHVERNIFNGDDWLENRIDRNQTIVEENFMPQSLKI